MRIWGRGSLAVWQAGRQVNLQVMEATRLPPPHPHPHPATAPCTSCGAAAVCGHPAGEDERQHDNERRGAARVGCLHCGGGGGWSACCQPAGDHPERHPQGGWAGGRVGGHVMGPTVPACYVRGAACLLQLTALRTPHSSAAPLAPLPLLVTYSGVYGAQHLHLCPTPIHAHHWWVIPRRMPARKHTQRNPRHFQVPARPPSVQWRLPEMPLPPSCLCTLPFGGTLPLGIASAGDVPCVLSMWLADTVSCCPLRHFLLPSLLQATSLPTAPSTCPSSTPSASAGTTCRCGCSAAIMCVMIDVCGTCFRRKGWLGGCLSRHSHQ